MSNIIIRAYQASDFDQVIRLFLLNTPQYFCPPEQQDLESFLKDELEYYYVAAEGTDILACGGCNVEGQTGWLSWYMVHPSHHGRGLGRMLAEHNLKILERNEQVTGIQVRTSQLVYPFYEKLGFELYETKDDYWGKGMHLYKMKLNRRISAK